MLRPLSPIKLILSLAGPALLLGGALAFAAPADAPSDDPIKDLRDACREFVEKKSVKKTAGLSKWNLVMRILFNQGSFVHPSAVQPKLDPLYERVAFPFDRKTKDQKTAPRLTLFTLGPVEKVTPADMGHLSIVREEIQYQAKLIRQLIKEKTVEGCIAQASWIGWKPEQLADLQRLQDEARPSRKRFEAQLTYQEARKAAKRHPDWKVVPAKSWSDILAELQAHPTEGVLIMSHADPRGRLHDSEDNEFPSRFFDAIPSAVRLIGLYSCDSEQVAQAYSLKEASRTRKFVTVRLDAPFDQMQAAPVQFFPVWAAKIQQTYLKDHVAPARAPDPVLCDLHLSTSGLSEGQALSVSLNGLPVGLWTAKDAEGGLRFPCGWISDPKAASIFVQPARVKQKLAIDSANLSVTIKYIEAPDSAVFTTRRSSRNADGSFRSAVLSPVN